MFVTPDGVAAAQVTAGAEPASRGSSAASTRSARSARSVRARRSRAWPNRRAPDRQRARSRRATGCCSSRRPTFRPTSCARPCAGASRTSSISTSTTPSSTCSRCRRMRAAGRARMMYAVTAKAELVKQRDRSRRGRRAQARRRSTFPSSALRNIATLLESEQRGAAFLYSATDAAPCCSCGKAFCIWRATSRPACATLAEAAEMRAELVAGLALEVRRSLDYFESHYEQTSIPQLHTSGLEHRGPRAARARASASPYAKCRSHDACSRPTRSSRPSCSGSACPRSARRCAGIPWRCSAMYQQINLYQPIFRKQRQIFSARDDGAGARRRRGRAASASTRYGRRAGSAARRPRSCSSKAARRR